MKKLLSVLLCGIMLLSLATGVFASELDPLTRKYNSFEAAMEIWVENNKPLDFLAAVAEEVNMDFKTCAEEVAKTKITAEVKANLSEDYLSGQVYVSYTYSVPVKFGENFKIDAYVKENQWIDYDFSTPENTKILSIQENKFSGKYDYMLMDAESLSESDIESIKRMVELIKTSLTDGIVEWSDISKTAFEKYATVEKTDGYVTATLTEDAFIDMLFDMATGFLSTDAMKDILEFAEVELNEEALEAEIVEMAKETVKSVNIFADNDALTIKFKTDEKGYMTECEEKLHFDFNIAEMAQALGATLEDIAPVTVENSDVDFYICAKATYANVNEGVNVSFPELTEENSRDLYAEIVEIDSMYDDYVLYVPEVIRASYVDGFSTDGKHYVNFEDFINSSNYSYDNLTGSRSVDDMGNVTLVFNSDFVNNVTVTGNVNSDEYTLGEYKLMCNKPFRVINDALYVNVDVLTAVLNCKVRSIEIVYISGTEPNPEPVYNYSLIRPNPGYVEPMQQEAENAFEGAASVGIIGGADGPTAVFVTE